MSMLRTEDKKQTRQDGFHKSGSIYFTKVEASPGALHGMLLEQQRKDFDPIQTRII
jgi:hypothetical protein